VRVGALRALGLGILADEGQEVLDGTLQAPGLEEIVLFFFFFFFFGGMRQEAVCVCVFFFFFFGEVLPGG
jgi:hypothetical protein